MNALLSKVGVLFSAAVMAGAACGQDLTRVAPAQSRAVIVRNVTVHPVSAAEIAGGAVLFNEGVVKAVMTGAELDNLMKTALFAPPGPEIIDGTGKHLYPGLIAAYSTLGMAEIVSIRPSRDTDEVGEATPEVIPATAVNPDSTLIPVARAGGVFAAGLFPQGGLVPGQVSVIRTHGWTNDDLTVKRSAGILVSWPWMRSVSGIEERRGGSERGGEDEQRRDTDNRLKGIQDLFDTAKTYNAQRDAYPDRAVDLRWEAMRPLFASGKDQAKLFILANDVDQINAAAAFAGERKLPAVIVGGRDAHLSAELLKKFDIPVIIDGTHKLPKRADSAYDEAATLPARLKALGVRFCIASGEEPANERNLNHAAGTAAAFGLPQEDAVKAITQWPAEILGIGDALGSIQVDRPATMILTNGNILEVTTRIERGWIDGRTVDLTNKQTELLKKYEEKYRQRGDLKDAKP